MALEACERCDGLVPAGRPVCPHCERARPRRRGVKLVARILGASAALATLMACYGMIAKPYGPNEGYDQDGDGSPATADCDDHRTDVFPGAADRFGDGVDSNCDGADGWRDPSVPLPDPGAMVVVPDEPVTPPAAIATDPDPNPNPNPVRPKAVATDPAPAP